MKKLVAGAAVAALLGSAAFADVSVGAWGRAVTGIGNATNGDSDGTDVQISNMQSWGDNGPRNGITFEGDHDGVIGFNAEAFLNGTSGWSVGDNAHVWYQPIEQLRVAIGLMDYNPLRSSAIYGLWDMKRVGTEGNKEPWTFMGQSATGAVVSVFPIEGLQFHASLNYPMQGSKVKSYGKGYSVDPDDTTYTSNLANVMGRQSSYALAYAIGGEEPIATIKVGLQELGRVVVKKDSDGTEYKDQNIINAAVDLQPMENLFISVGAFIPTVQYKMSDDSSTYTANGWKTASDVDYTNSFNRINAYLKFGAMEGLNIHARVGTKLNCPDLKEDDNGNIKEKDGQFGFLVGAGVDYALMDDLTLYADFGYANGIYWSCSTADNTDCLDFGIGVTKDYGEGCSVSAGFVGATNGNGMYDTTYTDDNGDTQYPFSWGIPLVITYSF